MLKKIPRILVISSSGTLAKSITNQVVASFGIQSLTISDYKVKRLQAFGKELQEQYGIEPKCKLIDINSFESIKNGIEDLDYVIVPVSQKQPLVQQVCIQKGIVCIDLTLSEAFIDNVLKLQSEAYNGKSLLLMAAGLFPGLSGLIANEIHKNSPDAIIDIGLLQSKDVMAGGTGIADMLQLFNQQVGYVTTVKKSNVSGFKLLKTFNFNNRFGEKKLRLANFSERKYLEQRLHIESNYWSAFDSEFFNKLIAFVKAIGLLNLFENPKYRLRAARLISILKSKVEKASIGVIVQSDETNKISFILESDYGATAACVMAFVKILDNRQEKQFGIFFPFELFELNEALAYIEHKIK